MAIGAAIVLGAAVSGAGALLASASDSPSGTFLQYGAIGAICVVLLVALAWTARVLLAAYNREKARADRLETQMAALNEEVRTSMIGTLSKGNDLLSAAYRRLEAQTRTIERLKAERAP